MKKGVNENMYLLSIGVPASITAFCFFHTRFAVCLLTGVCVAGFGVITAPTPAHKPS